MHALAGFGRSLQGAEEGRCPVAYVEFADPAPHRAHPAPGLGRRNGGRAHDDVLHDLDIVRVDEKRAAELVGRAGELAEYQRAGVIVAACDVFLGYEIHAVSQRRHQHYIGSEVQRGHFLRRVCLVQVVNRRVAELGILSVNPAHRDFDLVAQQPVLLDPLPAGAGYQHKCRPQGSESSLAEQLAVGGQTMKDALGVVEPVDAEQDDVWLSQRLPESTRPLPHLPMSLSGSAVRQTRYWWPP